MADWGPLLFVHYEVDPTRLQAGVPFELDLYEGKAYVSAVAFLQENMRMAGWPGITRWLMRAMSNHPFLNLRTYVRVGPESGIYFLSEWIPNRLDCLLGPPMYGLPYRLARVRYEVSDGAWLASVTGGDHAFTCRGTWCPIDAPMTAASGSLDEFLVERYTAYTSHSGVMRRFRIHHLPWPVMEGQAEVLDDGLLRHGREWFDGARLTGAHYTSGVSNVWIGKPCRLNEPKSRVGFAGAITALAVAGAWAIGSIWQVPAWAVMWLMTLALLFGFKGWMVAASGVDGTKFSARGWLGFLLLWPGMDPRPFASGAKNVVTQTPWLPGVARLIVGAVLFWGVARGVMHWDAVAAGWVGMIGMILMAHFGVFHLAACAWQRAGVPVRPLMNKPLLSRSVAEFWGRRWNVAFRDLADRLWYRPFHARFGKTASVLGVFVISGLLHELVISVPAGGGFGLPFGYFAIQGLAMIVERRWKYRHPLRGAVAAPLGMRLWTWLVVAGPVFWLFHPMFVTNVILPFMRAVGALGGMK
jgi:uncharacterized protein YqjF (DUF2071 family)